MLQARCHRPRASRVGTSPREDVVVFALRQSGREYQAFFYGDQLHWDRGAEDLARWREDPLTDAHHSLLFLEAIAQLASVYVGFGALVIAAVPVNAGT